MQEVNLLYLLHVLHENFLLVESHQENQTLEYLLTQPLLLDKGEYLLCYLHQSHLLLQALPQAGCDWPRLEAERRWPRVFQSILKRNDAH